MKLNWEILNQPNFLNALKKIREYDAKSEADKTIPPLTASTKLRLSTLSQVVYLEMLKAQASAKELLKTYAVKDEKGEIAGYPDATKIKFETPEREKKHDEAFLKMLKTPFKVPSSPILISSLEPIGLTTNELQALKPVLKDL